MNEQFIRDRISELRIQKGISEYKMSYDLGHSKSYIQSISSGRALPSMSEFLYICEYFGITPKEFFDTEIDDPFLMRQLLASASKLNEEDMMTLLRLSERLNRR